MRLFLSYAIRCGENFLCSCSTTRNVSFIIISNSEMLEASLVCFQNGRSPISSSRDVIVIYIDCALSFCCCFSLLCVALNGGKFMYTSRTPTQPQKRHQSGWQRKKTAEQKIIISRHVPLRFFPSVRCLSCMYLSYRYIIFGQIHLTNVYVRAYQ
jgi:hypothetical protein